MSRLSRDQAGLSDSWVFMGDSLTEGVGTSRVSYVAELVRLIRQSVREGTSPGEVRANLLRLRHVADDNRSRFVRFNLAGFVDREERSEGVNLWLWNLACEGKTIDSDREWVDLLGAITPSVVFIFRGGLESIIRPAAFHDASWPWWVPRGWRGYAAMDPRCYFSTTWWRKLKQQAFDAAKQRARLKLLQARAGRPMVEVDEFIESYRGLLAEVKRLRPRVIIAGMLPVDDGKFPGSAKQFRSLNEELRALAGREGVEFLDWGLAVESQPGKDKLYYRDGFHLNVQGAQFLARVLLQHLFHETVKL